MAFACLPPPSDELATKKRHYYGQLARGANDTVHHEACPDGGDLRSLDSAWGRSLKLAQRLLKLLSSGERQPSPEGCFAIASQLILALSLLSYGCLPPPIDDGTEQTPEYIVVDYIQVEPPDEFVLTNRNKAQTATVFDMTTAVSSTLGTQGKLYFYWYLDWKPTNPTDPVTPDESSGKFTFLTCSEHDPPNVTGETETYPLERRLMVVITTRPIPKAVKKNAYQAPLGDDADVVFYDWTLKFTDTEKPNCDPPTVEELP